MTHKKGEEQYDRHKIAFCCGSERRKTQRGNGEIIFVQINAFDHSLIFQILFEAHSKKNINFREVPLTYTFR